MTRFQFLPKQKQYSNHTPHNVQSKSNTQPSLPHFSSVTTNPNDYSLNTSPVDCEMDTPARIYSKTNYSFLRHLLPLITLTFSLLQPS